MTTTAAFDMLEPGPTARPDFQSMLVQACSSALASLPADLTADERATMAAISDTRISRLLAGSTKDAAARSIAHAYIGSLAFCLEYYTAAAARPGSQPADQGTARRMLLLLSDYAGSEKDPVRLLAAIGRCSPIAAGIADALDTVDGTETSSGDPASPFRPLLWTTLIALAAPSEPPSQLMEFLLGRTGTGRSCWHETLAVHLAWQIKTNAPFLHGLFSELVSLDPNVARATREFLGGFYASAQRSAEALEAHFEALLSQPAHPSPHEAIPVRRRPGDAGHRARHVAALFGLSQDSEATGRLLASVRPSKAQAGNPDWTRLLEAVSAASAAQRLQQAFTELRSRGEDGWDAGRLDRLLSDNDLDALQDLLDAFGGTARDAEAAALVLNLQADCALARSRHDLAVRHYLSALEAEGRLTPLRPTRTAARTCWALWLHARGNKAVLAHAQEFAFKLSTHSHYHLSSTEAEALGWTAGACAADRLGPEADPQAAAATAEVLRSVLRADQHRHDEAPRLKALVALAEMATLAARAPDHASRFLADAADAWLLALNSSATWVEPAARVEIARRLVEICLRRDAVEKQAGWPETAAMVAGCALLELELFPVEDAAAHTDTLAKVLTAAQSHLGRSRKSHFWLSGALLSTDGLLARASGGKRADLHIQKGQLLLQRGRMEAVGVEDLSQALDESNAVFGLIGEKDHWRRSCAMLIASNCYLEIGRRNNDRTALERCVGIAGTIDSVPAGNAMRMNTLQILVAAGEALALLDRSNDAAARFNEAREIARAAKSDWWQLEIERRWQRSRERSLDAEAAARAQPTA